MSQARIVIEVPMELKKSIQNRAKENNQSVKDYFVTLAQYDINHNTSNAYAETHSKELLSEALANIDTLHNNPKFHAMSDKLMENNLNKARDILCRLT